MSIRADTSSLVPGCIVASQYPGFGITGAALRAATGTGGTGAGPLYDDWRPGDDDKEFQWVVTAEPAEGVFTTYEDGSFSFLYAPDGVYTYTYTLYRDRVADADLGYGELYVGVQPPVVQPPAPEYALVSPDGVLPYVHDDLPAVPYLVAMRAVIDAVREFCAVSTVWRETSTSLQTEVARGDYLVDMPGDGEMVALHMVVLGDRELRIFGQAQAARLARAYATQPAPVAVTPVQATAIRFHPAPRAVEDFTVEASLRPPRGATEVPAFLVAQYAKELGDGAKMYLCKQTGAPWYDMKAAGQFGTDFYRAAHSARREMENGLAGAPQQVEIPKWV